MKKALHIIFICYFLGLAFVPCSEKENCQEYCQENPQSQNHEDESNEICTPFCVCSSCAAHFVVDEPTITHSFEGEINSRHVEGSLFASSNVSQAIWQPPKISA